MSDLLPAAYGGAVPKGKRRELVRTLAGIDANTSVDVARVRAGADVGCARVEAIAAVSTVGLFEVGNVSAIERAMFERVPHAGARLQLVADSAAAGISQVVMGMSRSSR